LPDFVRQLTLTREQNKYSRSDSVMNSKIPQGFMVAGHMDGSPLEVTMENLS
jgi:hypothetical protein